MTFEARKNRLMEKVAHLRDERMVEKLKALLQDSPDETQALDLFAPLEEEIDLARLKETQNYQPLKVDELNHFIEKVNILESLEELVLMD